MSIITYNDQSIQSDNITRVSEVFSIDSDIIDKENNVYKQKYHFKIFTCGEIIWSLDYDTENEAESERTSFLGMI